MAIEFTCDSCGKRFTVKDGLAGKKGKCSACGSPIEVPPAPREEAYTLDPEPVASAPAPASPNPEATPAGVVALDDVSPGPGAIDLGIATEPSPWSAPSAPIGLGSNPGFPQRVVVVNFDMKFTTLVRFMVKVAIASIPATIILWLILFTLLGIFYGIINALVPSVTRPAPTMIPRPAVIERRPESDPSLPGNVPDEEPADEMPRAVRKR